MARSLADIEKIIMTQRPVSMKEWIDLEREVDEAMREASEKEIDSFVEGGAGEILDMTCSAIRNIQKNN